MMGKRSLRMQRLVLGCSVAIVCCTSCGLSKSQRAAIGEFSQAATMLGTQAAAEFPRIRQQNIELNAYLVTMGPSSGQPDLNLENDLTVKATNTREQAAQALQSYGELLWTLVQDGQQEELKAAAKKFAVSVKGLPSGDKKLSDKQLTAIGKAVHAAGGLIVEEMKKRAVVAIVQGEEMKKQVDALCDLLVKDFAPDSRYSSQLNKTASAVIVLADEKLQTNLKIFERALLVKALRDAQSAKSRCTMLHSAIVEAAKNMKQANAGLTKALEDDTVSIERIEDFWKSVKPIYDALRTIAND